MPRKTVKFTYEGSSKFIKLIFLLGLIPYRIGGFVFLMSFIAFFPIYLFKFNSDAVAIDLIAMAVSLFLLILGRSIAAFAQFVNWMDRGSVNSKIFKKL